MRLLTPEVIKSRDSKGRGIWLRFTQDVFPLTSSDSLRCPSSLYFLSSFMCMAISCLVTVGALADYEKESKKWAVSCIATKGLIRRRYLDHLAFRSESAGRRIRHHGLLQRGRGGTSDVGGRRLWYARSRRAAGPMRLRRTQASAMHAPSREVGFRGLSSSSAHRR
ncbi:hypothetical protein LB503_006246 [Fusarium chuoi]|nr:hypothetical protein LB503_006246 [Fusarium chuoi]